VFAAGIVADSPQAVKATKPAGKERPTEATFPAFGFVLLGLRTMSGKPVAALIKIILDTTTVWTKLCGIELFANF